mmetsp:Transcript_12708/g.43333  ORF Transcript_12708/g.43333 Transcript_12708/m.43333 type:complete len:254 (+) Transcript_12708:148-909(+)
MPRAATSVATRTVKAPRRNWASVVSRWAWPMSPWSTWAARRWNAGPPASSSHSFLVEVKTMTRPPPCAASSVAWPEFLEISTAMMSSRSDARASGPRGTSTALCVTVVAACWRASPTTSTSSGSSRYLDVSFLTQDGVVAEKRSVWGRRSGAAASAGGGAAPRRPSRSKPFSDRSRADRAAREPPRALPAGHSEKMRSTSSAKPMESISSASSRTTWYASDRSKLPRSMWSMTRPTVATSTSTPRRSAFSWGP